MKRKIVNIMKIVALVIVIVLTFFIGCRSFEEKSLYFPGSRFYSSPADIGLDFEEFEVKTESGELIHGWIVPATPSESVLLFCHGNAGNISDRLKSIEIFHDLQLTTVIFDYPGYGRSSGKPSEKSLYRSAGAVFDFLKQRFPKEKSIIFGRSLGSAVAVELASKVETDALIVESAMTSVPDMARQIYPFLPSVFISQKFDSLSKVKEIKRPKLFIHSSSDEIVPLDQGRNLFNSASEPKVFLQIRGSHNDGFLVSRDEYINGLEEFLESNDLR